MNLNRRELIYFGAAVLAVGGSAKAVTRQTPLAIIVDRTRFSERHKSKQCLILERGNYVNEALLRRFPPGIYEADLEPANQFLLEQLSRSRKAVTFEVG